VSASRHASGRAEDSVDDLFTLLDEGDRQHIVSRLTA
jgi:hypothetical protein